MTSATNDREEDYDDGNEEFVVKKETTPYPKGLFAYVCVIIALSFVSPFF